MGKVIYGTDEIPTKFEEKENYSKGENNNMEFIVSEVKELAPIKFNYEELKKELVSKLDVYKTIVYQEEDIKNATDDRAKLNKLLKAITDKRIETEREFNKPLEDFKIKTKELEVLVKDTVVLIDIQVKSFEEKEKNEKLQIIVKFFEEKSKELKELLNFDILFNPKWLNKKYKMKDIEDEIQHFITKSRQDLEVIKNLNSEFEDVLIDFYFKCLSLSNTMQEKTRLEENKKKIENLENAKKIEDENIQKQTMATQKASNNFKTTVVFNISANNQADNDLQQIDFRVWVTQEQKFILREFIVKNNIKYGPVK